MSADNGIYILRTINKNKSTYLTHPYEYRVAHLTAIEDVNYDENAPDPNEYRPNTFDYDDGELHSVNEYIPENTKHLEWQKAYRAKVNSEDSKVQINNARTMWGHCSIFYTRSEALDYADKIYQQIMESKFPVLEYGISFITIEEVF